MTGGAVEAVNPATGEVLERLNEQPPEALAEALDAIYAQQARLKEWEAAIGGELRRRLRLRKSKLVVFGDWEVEASTVRSAEWDVAELETVLQQLVDEGVVRAADVGEIVTRNPVVSKSKAGQLASRLTGDARERVAALRTWQEKPGKLTVAKSVQLLDAASPPAAEETPPVGGQADRGGFAPDADPAPAGFPEPPRAARASSLPHTPAAARGAPEAGPAQTPTPLDPQELFA